MEISLSTRILRGMNLIEALKLISEKGYYGAEIWENQIQQDFKSISRLKKYLQQSKLAITLHSIFDDTNLSSTNREIRGISLKQTKDSIKLASKLGIRKTTIHPGRKTSSKDNPDHLWELDRKSVV